MKKILLVPLMAISLLTGCNTNKEKPEEETIYTPYDWLKDTDVFENDLRYYCGIDSSYDYDKVVAKKMLDRFDIEFKYPHKIEKANQYGLFTYIVKKNIAPYTQCTFYFHETTVETVAIGRVNNELVKQCTSYDCYTSYMIVDLIKFASKRAEETDKIRKEEHEAATEAGTLENFYKGIEESTTNPIATFSNVIKEDTNHALLDDIKDLFSPYSEKAYRVDEDGYFMSYGLDENFMLRFYLDYEDEPIAILKYKYQSSLNYTDSYEIGYKVSREKIDNIIKKITGTTN